MSRRANTRTTKRSRRDEEEEENSDDGGVTTAPSSDEEEEDDVEPSAKKQRANSSDDDLPTFRKGAIVRCKLQNFMTYDNCEFMPGPGMNLVLGPNGTGKSSIVSAICVGLGANPKILGRASKVKDYIKHGKSEAIIELELYNTPKNIVITRIFKKVHDTSAATEWKLNGVRATPEKVAETVKKFNIQLENLTQFLPQDKVAQFASMNPVQLLQSTAEAILPPEVIRLQKELVEQKKTQSSKSDTVAELTMVIAQLKKKNELLERDVEKYQQKLKHLQRIDQLESKKPFIQFAKLQKDANKLKDELTELERELNRRRNAVEPLKEQLEALKVKTDKHQAEYHKGKEKVRVMTQAVSQLTGQLENTRNEQTAHENNLRSFFKRIEERKSRAERAVKQLEEQKKQLDVLMSKYDTQDLQKQIQQLLKESMTFDNEVSNVQGRRHEAQDQIRVLEKERATLQSRITELDNVKEKRTEALKSSHQTKDAYEAYQWCKQNRNLFKGEWYLVCREINVPDQNHASYIEMHCPGWLLTAIVCSDIHDRNLLQKELVDGKRLRMTVVQRDISEQESEYVHPRPKEQLAKYDITHYLDETFDAPKLVKFVMNENASLYRVAVGTTKTTPLIRTMMDETDILSIFTPESQYAGRRSRYDKSTLSTRVTPVKRSRILIGVDMKKKEEYEKSVKEITAKMEQLSTLRKQLEKEEQEKLSKQQIVQAKKRELEEYKKNVNKKKGEVERLQRDVEMLEQEEDVTGVERNLRKKLADTALQRKRLVIELEKKHSEMMVAVTRTDLFIPIKFIVQSKEGVIKEQIREIEDKFRELEKNKRLKEEEMKKIKSSLIEVKDKALNAQQQYCTKYDIKEEDFKKMLLSLPEDLDTLEEEIAAEQSVAESLYADSSVVQEYEKREEEIKQKEDQLATIQASLDTLEERMRDMEKEWKKPLQDCVNSIDATFSKFCKNIGINGNVALGVKEDYEKWEIQLMVKFRDQEQLTRLDSSRQSGGERSVTTILYLLSLQQLNKAPFRVVDEINQGMDPVNERKIFLQMLESSKGPNIPQTFLVTPKLLPNLVPEAAKNLTILFIYNGPFNLYQKDLFDFEKKLNLQI